MPVQHIEFFHRDHFEYYYHRQKAKHSLARFIDFFWETDFDALWAGHPNGFTDLLYPDVGYTYLINLGTPFTMQLDKAVYEVKSDGFLPRYKYITTHHVAGNKIFGIKFKVSPVIFEKKINFSEYRGYIYPLAYLMDRALIAHVKATATFSERMQVVSDYYSRIIHKYAGSMKQVDTVTDILHESNEHQPYTTSIADLAAQYHISTRTLQRYFEATTSINAKQALQLVRIRRAIKELVSAPATFDCTRFGYYDRSHFYKHMQRFLQQHPTAAVPSYQQLLEGTDTMINY